MSKYEILVGMLVGFDLEDWISYNEGEGKVMCDLKKRISADEVQYVSLILEKKGNKYNTYIRKVMDTDITSIQGKELFNLLKEKYDMKQELKKKEAWAILGVY